jgi:hypothetical protein
MKIFDKILTKLETSNPQWQPRKVFLFSGHMIDRPGRVQPRFPAQMEPQAAKAIGDKLDALDAGPQDLALCGGACGGDILFAEACLQRGLHLELRLPLTEAEFIQESVVFAGKHWCNRFSDVKKNERTKLFIMTKELGKLPKGADPFKRNNRWQLDRALSWGAEKVIFICLWNLEGGDGPGGTKHMHDEVKKRLGQVHILDTNQLFKDGEK